MRAVVYSLALALRTLCLLAGDCPAPNAAASEGRLLRSRKGDKSLSAAAAALGPLPPTPLPPPLPPPRRGRGGLRSPSASALARVCVCVRVCARTGDRSLSESARVCACVCARARTGDRSLSESARGAPAATAPKSTHPLPSSRSIFTRRPMPPSSSSAEGRQAVRWSVS